MAVKKNEKKINKKNVHAIIKNDHSLCQLSFPSDKKKQSCAWYINDQINSEKQLLFFNNKLYETQAATKIGFV